MALPIGKHTHPSLNAVNFAKVKLTDSPRLLGRTAAGAGSAEEITVGTGLTLAAGALSSTITPANPSSSVGLAAVNGAATTYMRSDAAPALSQAISPTWTGTHIFNNNVTAPVYNATTGYRIGGAAASGHFLRGNGTNYVDGVIAAADLPANAANPSAAIGLAAVNGSATTWMRSDAAPALSVAIAPTWTGKHTWGAQAAGASVLSNPILMLNSLTGLSGARSVILHGENSSERWFIGSNGAAQFEGGAYGVASTWASPTHTELGQQLISLTGFGWDNAGTPSLTGARTRFAAIASQAWTTTAQGTYLSLQATPDNTVVIAEVMRITGLSALVNGYMNIGASIVAPAHTTPGDLSAIRAFISGNLDLSAQITGTGLTFGSQAYNAGDFTATSGAWTVDAGDLASFIYMQIGRTIVVDFRIDTSTTSLATGNIMIKIPNGKTSNQSGHGFGWIFDGTNAFAMRCFVAAGSNLITLGRVDTLNIAAVTNTLYVQGFILFEVQ